MKIGEAKLSALGVSALTGVGLTLMLSQALRDLGFALSISVPVTLVMGALLFVFANDNTGRRDKSAPPQKSSKGK